MGRLSDRHSDLGRFWAWVFSIAPLAVQERHLCVVRMRTWYQPKDSSL